jgi:glycine/D-amino acid oxidase-like deaminating enzyme
MRVAVVGAGVFGAAAALELRRRGHDVALLDPGPLPHPLAASTDASKIVRLDYGADALATGLMERALPRWRAWNEELRRAGEAPVFHETGLLVLSGRPLAPGTFEGDSFALLTARGHRLERLDAAALAARHPAFAADRFPDGYWNPQGGWAESGRVTAWLARRARDAGAALLEGLQVRELLRRDGRVAGLRALDAAGAMRALPADAVVLAAGAWSGTLLPELREDPPPLRVVGQTVLFFRPERPEALRAPALPPFTADIAATGFYGFPALPDGRVKLANHGAGSSLPDADAPRTVDPGFEATARAFLRDALPVLEDAPLAESRLCLYCDTPDGHFLIDEHPRLPGLWLATGGSGHAFKFAPVLGELLADGMERREGAPQAEFLARCGWREAGAGRGDCARAGGSD